MGWNFARRSQGYVEPCYGNIRTPVFCIWLTPRKRQAETCSPSRTPGAGGSSLRGVMSAQDFMRSIIRPTFRQWARRPLTFGRYDSVAVLGCTLDTLEQRHMPGLLAMDSFQVIVHESFSKASLT